MRVLSAVALAAFGLAGCLGGPKPIPPFNDASPAVDGGASWSDASGFDGGSDAGCPQHDGSLPDGSIPDGGCLVPDGGPIDGGPDADILDGDVDADIVDGDVIDGDVIDASLDP